MIPIEEIFQQFDCPGTFKEAIPVVQGHINQTLIIHCEEETIAGYVLQRINNSVFSDVPGLMENLVQIIHYLNKYGADPNHGNFPYEIPTLYFTSTGKSWLIDEELKHWRLFNFLPGSHSIHHPESLDLIREGGKAFGWFLNTLSLVPSSNFNITIPNFHNLRFRLKQFQQSEAGANSNLLKMAAKEVSFVQQWSSQMLLIEDLGNQNKIPLRTTHNDTKFENLLVDSNLQVKCVIDLDTVMAGFIHYDFGDAIRSIVSNLEEDAENIEEMEIDLEKFEAFATGYFEKCGNVLTATEKSTLSISGAVMSFIMGVRFLTDFLNGNIYYKVKFPEHNLIRAKCQLGLAELMIKRKGEMELILKKYL